MNQLRIVAFLAVLVFVLFAACNGDRDDFQGSSSSSAASSSSSSGAGGDLVIGAGGGLIGDDDSFMMDPCPADPPTAGAFCNHWGMDCGYGQDPRPECRNRFICVQPGPDPLTWGDFTPEVQCPPIDSANCPATPPSDSLPVPSFCAPNGTMCNYATGAQCVCNDNWLCADAPITGCPGIAPNMGHACDVPGLVCKYGDCTFGTAMIRKCRWGVWQGEQTDCE